MSEEQENRKFWSDDLLLLGNCCFSFIRTLGPGIGARNPSLEEQRNGRKQEIANVSLKRLETAWLSPISSEWILKRCPRREIRWKCKRFNRYIEWNDLHSMNTMLDRELNWTHLPMRNGTSKIYEREPYPVLRGVCVVKQINLLLC